MKRAAYPRKTAHPAALLMLSASCAAALLGPPAARGDDAAIDMLRAEVRPLKSLNDPALPIWVRFILHNPTDYPIDIPLPSGAPTDGAVTIPSDVLFGSSTQPAIAVGFQSEALATIPPPATTPSTDPNVAHSLRLAPRSAVGTDLDLRSYFRAMRYDGVYRVEWRPLEGRMQGATADVLVERRKDAIIITDQGKMTFTLHYDQAPRNVDNFLNLVRTGFYEGKTFHRIVPGFIIQGGCPSGDGTGIRPDGILVPAEFNHTPVELGTLLMAHKPTDPNSASCQFFIALARLPDLDGQYTVIGQAYDTETARTLQALAATATGKQDRPVQSVVIRSIKLLDAVPPVTTRSARP
jgi:cyclophilin family peptidyl-prolyl cis-trans isomerase